MEKYQLQHTLFDGGWSKPLSRELFERGHAVAVLLYDPKEDAVVMVEQFRIGALGHPDHPWFLEVVAGMVEEGESEEEVARRESVEEAGCRVGEMEFIARYWVSP
ncbi:MAG TPA: NUDIX domain-containing protein, partial [Gammaproteobacteria bacterium]|nr:NUDIX domain-containing protein [Gammaproteobacteria bacterium]